MDKKITKSQFCFQFCLKFDKEVWYDLHLSLVNKIEGILDSRRKENVFQNDSAAFYNSKNCLQLTFFPNLTQ